MALKVNVSSKAAEKRSFEELPLGWYHVQIAEVELRESKSEANAGKPMYGFEFEITDDPRNPQDDNGASKYKGRRLWTNACLWEGAEFTIVNILRALGHEIVPGELNVPDVTDDNERDQLVGQYLMVRQGITRKERLASAKAKPPRKPDPEITGFRSADEGEEGDSSAAAPAVTSRRRVL